MLKRLLEPLLRRFRGRRRDAEPGSWVDGSYASWRGWLAYAPWVAPARRYRLYIPRGYRADARLPLLVMLHGCKQDPDSFAAGTAMNRLADRHGFLVLYPHQQSRFNPYRCWNWFDPFTQHGGGEAAVVAGAAAAIAAAYAVDKNRVYIAGLSAGAALTVILALRRRRLFAAAAVHAGLPYAAATTPFGALQAMREGAAPAPAPDSWLGLPWRRRPPPLAIFHGVADDVVNPVNALRLTEQLLDLSRRRGDAVTMTEKLITDDGGYDYRRFDYYRGKRLLLSRFEIERLGHAWSGGDASEPYNDPRGPDASRLSWEFFTRHGR